jgi:molecular chaperone HtpG
VLDLLEKMEPEKYLAFWKAFGAVLKEGLAEDHANRERIAKLLRFASTRSADASTLVSLDDYIARMREGQEAIYYLTADGWNAAKNSPQLEALRARDIEVLLLHERIDEWMIGYLHEYAGKKLQHVAKGELPLDDGAEHEVKSKAAEGVVAKLKEALGDKVKDVRVSRRLTDSPSCLVLDEYDMALHMQRLLKSAGHDVPAAAPVLEINPSHPLLQRFERSGNADLALLLFEQAQLAEGAALDDPAGFVKRMNALLLQA